MNSKTLSRVSMVLALVGFVALTVGCASMKKSGVERAEKTKTSMQTVDYDIKQTNLQIDTTKASLDSLLRVGQMPASQPDDVKTAYKTFSENADRMKEIGKDLNKDIDGMSTEGNAYFTEWAKEGGTYTNPQIQKQSEDRRIRLNSAFRDMESAAASARPHLNSYLADIDQIQKYLSNDLTPGAIAAIVPTANSLGQNGNKLKESLVPVEKAIMEARAELTAGGAAAGGVSGTQHQTTTNPAAPDAGK